MLYIYIITVVDLSYISDMKNKTTIKKIAHDSTCIHIVLNIIEYQHDM